MHMRLKKRCVTLGSTRSDWSYSLIYKNTSLKRFLKTHLDKRNTYVRMLVIYYRSAFNTIVPSKLIIKLEALGLNPGPVQLGPGLPDGPSPGGEGRKENLHFADHQHWGPTRVRAQSPPVLPAHP
jgi:hypothetical protein